MKFASALSAVIAGIIIWAASAAAAAEPPTPPPSMYWGELQGTATGAGATYSIQTMGMKYFTEHLGAWFWTQSTKSWAEGYVGAMFAVTPEIQFGVAGGFETNSPAWRVGYIAGYYTGDHYAEVFGEYGGSGYWLRVHGNYQVNDWFGIGVHGESNLGVGPRVRLRLPSGTIPYPLELWGAPLFDWNGNGALASYVSGIVGLRINL